MILPPAPASPATAGGKGLALLRAAGAGFPVPPFLILRPDTVPPGWPGTDSPPTLTPGQKADLRALITPHLPAAATYAVRSSAIEEDGARHSFAGQLESFLHVPPEDLPEKIAAVWLSGRSDRVRAYRQSQGLTGEPEWPAVIIQVMIQPVAAGVAFSVDPLHPESGERIVAAVSGDGEKLVSGACDATTWKVPAGGSAGEPVDNPDPALHLPPEVVSQIADLATRSAAYFESPQDIEWAWDGETVFLLQSRPITTLSASNGEVSSPDTLTLWDNSNIAESYNGVTSPLTFSFARFIYAEVYQQFCHFLCVPKARIAKNRMVFAGMLGLIRGRIYYHLLNWYRLIAMLPGFRMNRGFMEQMMGVQEALPGPLVVKIVAENRGSRVGDALALSRTTFALGWHWLTLRWRIRRFHRRLEEALQETGNDLAGASPVELARRFRLLEDRLLRRWDAPLINDFFTMIAFGLLRSFCRGIDLTEGESLANHLVAGEGTMISIEPSRRVRRIAELVAREADLCNLLQTGSREDIEAGLLRYPLVAGEIQAYLNRFGDRCLEELKLESFPLTAHPEPLYRSIGALARHLASNPGEEKEDRAAAARAEADQCIEEALQYQPFRRWRYRRLRDAATRRIGDRENLRYERTRLFGRVRQIFLGLGRALVKEGVLRNEREVFFLTTEEVLGYVEGTSPSLALGDLARIREKEFARYREEPEPPGRLTLHGPVGQYRPEELSGIRPFGSDTLQGMGCCPGRVRGVVKVIKDPTRATIEPGEILVAARTDPGWVMLFPLASAVLVQHGSLLSHSAIVAREMGIPAIVSISGLLETLRTGDVVEMDGQAGWIRRLPPESDT